MKVYAKDMMQKDVATVRQDLPLADLERRFVDENVSGFPVFDGDTIKGVVSASDILRQLCQERNAAGMKTAFYEDDSGLEFISLESDWIASEVGKRMDHLTVADVMNSNVISVTSDTTLHDVAALMNKEKIHRVLVIDDGKLVGLLSSLDIVRACGNDLVDISFTAPEIRDF